MLDQYGRTIDYMRISVTDRCNLRCRYCMPNGVPLTDHEAVLRYEEILTICRCAVSLGITKFKITGGEPLHRRGCCGFIKELKALPGVEQVTITTNGTLLAGLLDQLVDAGVDAVNISLDTLDNALYCSLTGQRNWNASDIQAAAEQCIRRGIRTKLNAVLLPDTASSVVPLAKLAEKLPVDVRFIELMPIGEGAAIRRLPSEDALKALTAAWPKLQEISERRGNGPARYFRADGLVGCIGIIDAVSHAFCRDCNRVRLTSTGLLKPCLCYEEGADLRAPIRGGCSEEELTALLRQTIFKKPGHHCFDAPGRITEHMTMRQIGG